jgi:hypothetical protein
MRKTRDDLHPGDVILYNLSARRIQTITRRGATWNVQFEGEAHDNHQLAFERYVVVMAAADDQ